MEWRDCVGFNGYRVSDTGLVKTFKGRNPGAIKSQNNHHQGYKRLQLCVDDIKIGVTVHRLVAAAFIENPEKLKYVNHKNGIKHDNRVENLEWCSSGDNQRHAYRTGLKPKRKPLAKINQLIADIIRSRSSESTTILMTEFGLSRTAINRIKNYTTWR